MEYFFAKTEGRRDGDNNQEQSLESIIKNATYFYCLNLIEQNTDNLVFEKEKLWALHNNLTLFGNKIKSILPNNSDQCLLAAERLRGIIHRYYTEQ